MNNSLNIELEPEFLQETTGEERLREREAELVRVLEAIARIIESPAWSTLKKSVFDGVVENLEKDLVREAKKDDVNLPELYRLQGKLALAKRHLRLETLYENSRVELANIRKQLNPSGPTEL